MALIFWQVILMIPVAAALSSCVWAVIKRRWIFAGTMALVQSVLFVTVGRLTENIIVSKLCAGMTVFWFLLGVFLLAVVNKAFKRQKTGPRS